MQIAFGILKQKVNSFSVLNVIKFTVFHIKNVKQTKIRECFFFCYCSVWFYVYQKLISKQTPETKVKNEWTNNSKSFNQHDRPRHHRLVIFRCAREGEEEWKKSSDETRHAYLTSALSISLNENVCLVAICHTCVFSGRAPYWFCIKNT